MADHKPQTNYPRAHWGSRLAFVLAAAGSAIGLGNIWKFPYVAGENGGGAFVLIYLACIAVVGIPIFIAELYIGQSSQKNAVQAFEQIHKKGSFWRLPGWMGLISAFLILSFYSVVGGWIFDFEMRSLLGELTSGSEESIAGSLGELITSPVRQSIWHFIFMSATVAIVLGGVKDGLERWNKILMPFLLVILGGLFLYSMSLSGFGDALSFLFAPDTSKLTPSGILEAIGHSFFTLSLGMGCIITYGSYLEKKEHIVKVAFQVAFLDAAIALMAGLVIFSVVFSFDLNPEAGPGLIFSTLPVLFSKLPGGMFISIFFFLLVSFAALTSAVSILEVVVAYWTETHQMNRKKSTIVMGSLIFLTGLLCVFSNNIMKDVKILGLTFFDLFDTATSSYLLPIGGLLISLFYGWVIGRKAVTETIHKRQGWAIQGLLWTTRVLAPILVLMVIYNKIMG
jgi:NSS family neurotransmitter:Na+ symporter